MVGREGGHEACADAGGVGRVGGSALCSYQIRDRTRRARYAAHMPAAACYACPHRSASEMQIGHTCVQDALAMTEKAQGVGRPRTPVTYCSRPACAGIP